MPANGKCTDEQENHRNDVKRSVQFRQDAIRVDELNCSVFRRFLLYCIREESYEETD